MPAEGKKRPPRTPKTPEEIAELVLLKKIREHQKVERFKKTKFYKLANIFNILCFFIYCELIICLLGPCHYQMHYSRFVKAEYEGDKINGIRPIKYLKVTGIDGKYYEFVIHDYIEKPEHKSQFFIGKDFLFQKDLKGGVSTSDKIYYLYQAGSVIFLAAFVAIFSCVFFSYNLNQHPHSLRAMTIMNLAALFGCLVV